MNWNVLATSAGLLILSNVFTTFAWYAHLKELSAKPWWIAALLSWAVALFEYLLQVPANRIGYTALSLPQQENHAGGDHPHSVRAVRDSLHEPALEMGLPVGRALHDGRGLFHLSLTGWKGLVYDCRPPGNTG